MAFNPLGIFGNKPTQVSAPTNTTDAEKLAQVMGGNLSGTLSGGDKLMALSALLKSVSRGSQTTPQQALAQIQQQKMNELQGKLQIEQMRKQALGSAQLEAAWSQFVNSQPANLQPYFNALPAEKRADVLAEQLKPKETTRLSFDQLGRARDPFTGRVINPEAEQRGLKLISSPNDPAYASLPAGADFVDFEGNIRRKGK